MFMVQSNTWPGSIPILLFLSDLSELGKCWEMLRNFSPFGNSFWIRVVSKRTD